MGQILSEVVIFVVVMLTSALDFWTVKSVTGILLVGMKWSCDEEGVCRFENVRSDYLSN
jgi:hypothetical protein